MIMGFKKFALELLSLLYAFESLLLTFVSGLQTFDLLLPAFEFYLGLENF